MARPTKLTKDILEKADGYIGETKMGGLFHGDLPSIAGLAIYLGVARSSLYEWSDLEKHPGTLHVEFSDILEAIMTEQEYKLVGKSLKGEYNATISRMLLNSKHGYVESTKTDVTSGGEKIDNPYSSLTLQELKKLARGK